MVGRRGAPARGLRFDQSPLGDVGFGVALTIDEESAEPMAGAIPTYGHPVATEEHPPR